jgi:uracil-DNA glycosylase
MESLRREYVGCKKCFRLCQNRTQVVFGEGSQNAEILFIGEAPGATEDRIGKPFCGMSGKVLDELLLGIALRREDVFITNTILCRPPNNANPLKEEVANCRERLDRLIQIIQPKVIVTIGNFATKRILGKTAIKSIHGKIFSLKFGEKVMSVVPVIHPANFLYSGRNRDLWAEMLRDFETIRNLSN